MVLCPHLVVSAECQVYQKLAEVSHVGMEISVLEVEEILQDHLVNDWALVTELLVQLCLM